MHGTYDKRPQLRIGILGGSSLLGEHALPLLAQTGLPTNAFTRSLPTVSCPGVTWRNADDWHGLTLDTFLSFAPVWVLPDYLERLASTHVKRVVVLSSTSRFAKQTSPDARERDVAQRLIRAEEQARAVGDRTASRMGDPAADHDLWLWSRQEHLANSTFHSTLRIFPAYRGAEPDCASRCMLVT